MRAELTQKLVDDFPDLFQDIGAYVEIQDGWYDLLYRFCKSISCFTSLAVDTSVRFAEIKEKYGLLRVSFTVEPFDSELAHLFTTLAAELEQRSGAVCEDCGGVVNVRTSEVPDGYWVRTQCDTCRRPENSCPSTLTQDV